MLKTPILHRILVVLSGLAGLVASQPDLTIRQLLVMACAALVGVGSVNIGGKAWCGR